MTPSRPAPAATAALSLLAGLLPAAADTLHVPGDYPTITAAVAAAGPGDTILVADGEYCVNQLNIGSKSLILRSENGPAACVIKPCDVADGRLFELPTGGGAVIEGFTLTGANQVDDIGPEPWKGGAAIRVRGGSLTVADCVIGSCKTTGVYNCDGTGGAVYAENCDLDISGTLFAWNSTWVSCCAGWGWGPGGAIYVKDATLTLTRCDFTSNRASSCDFWSGDYGPGGALFAENADVVAEGCRFIENKGSHGGGAAIGTGASGTFINCEFRGNAANNDCSDTGAALFASNATLDVVNCTFGGNTVVDWCFAYPQAGAAIGLAGVGASAVLTNIVVWGNISEYPPAGGGFIYVGPDAAAEIHSSILENGDEGVVVKGGTYSSTGIVAANPLFVSQSDLSLQPGSPAIDAGDNTAVPGGVTTDLAGNPRFIDDPDTADTGIGTPPIVDLGAYEFQAGQSCYPDLDGNGDLNLFDFFAFVNLFNNTDPAADCDQSGALDLFDFLCFNNAFNQGC